ncbi:MAG: hypothetical protein PVH68_06180 [Armatimonadota bacterium]|jgi:hypothetical protein
MMWPPSILWLRVVDDGQRKIRLWLPLFLFWPILLLLAIALLPMVLLVALICRGLRGAGRALLGAWYLYATVCSLRGLTIEVSGEGDEVLVSVR